MVSDATATKSEWTTITLLKVSVASVAESSGVRETELAWKQETWVALCFDCDSIIAAAARAWYDETDQCGEAHLELVASWLGNTRRFSVACEPNVRMCVKMLPVPGPDGEERVYATGRRPVEDLAAVADLIAVRCARAAAGHCVYTMDQAAKEIAELGKYIRGGARSGAGEAQAGAGCPEGQWRG